MIRVRHDQAGDLHRLTVTGHADYGPHGADIVCAGVSALTYALLASAEKLGGHIVYCNAESGNVKIVCYNADSAFEVALTGLELIAEKYPQNVEVIDAAQGGWPGGKAPDDLGERP